MMREKYRQPRVFCLMRPDNSLFLAVEVKQVRKNEKEEKTCQLSLL